MWDVLVRTPRGRNNPRKLSMLLATFLMACFGYIFLASTPVNALDGTWKKDDIVYDGNTYTPVPATTKLPVDVPSEATSYQFKDTSKTPNLVHIIYFSEGVNDPKSAKEATYIRYTLNPPNELVKPTDEKKITLVPSNPTTPDKGDGALTHGCTIDGIGWIVCPLMNGISEGMDFIYEKIRGFLEVQPISTSVDNPIYRIWMYSRDLANIAFIIGFLVIIYSYLVGGGFSGYEIRKIIPRLVVAAVLINISYIICSVAVDISNIAGYGVNGLFETVRDQTLSGSDGGNSVNWKDITGWVLAGGTGATVGALALPAVVGGAAGGLWFMLAPFLLGGALLVMVTFLILAARQAIIIVAIAIAPLAFAAYILPNTEKWFERWRGLFFTMLVMFPAFGAVFGGAQLAGDLIIRTAAANGRAEQIILGLGVMVAPLAITPLLLKLGGGILNRIGGIVNNRQKGIYDRYKNYNKERLADHVAKNNKRNAEMLANGGFKKRQFMRRRAAYDYAKKNYRENQRKFDEEAAQNSWHRQTGRWGYDNHGERGEQRSRITKLSKDGYGNLDTYKRDNQLAHNQTEAHHEEHWQQLLQSDATRRGILTDTRLSEGRSKVVAGAMEAQDERTLQTALDSDARYAALRKMKVQTVVDKGVADNAAKAIDADGSAALAETILNDNRLKQQVIRTYEQQGRATQANELVEDAAKANWEKLTLTDRTLYSRQFERQSNAKELKALQNEWESILVEAGAGRTDDYQAKFGPMTQQVATSVQRIQSADEAIAVEAFRKARAEYVDKVNLNQALKQNPELLRRAAGIDEEGNTKVLAELQKEASGLYMQNVEAAKSVFTNDKAYTNARLKQVYRDGVLADGSTATLTQRHAALQRLLMETGNNYAVQDIIDFSNELGVVEDREQAGVFRDMYGNVLTDEEVDSRRDTQQIINDAYAKSKNKVDWHSGTDRGNAESGRHVVRDRNGRIRTDFAGSEVSITSEINKGKVDRDRALNADIDVIDKQAMVLADARVRNELIEPEAAKQYADTLEEFLKDPLTGMRLEKRKRGSYHVLLKELRAVESGTPIDLSQIEDEYVDVESGEIRKILDENKISRKAQTSSSQRPQGPIRLKP